MLGTFKKSEQGDAPALSWRVWLLVPLCMVGLMGLVIPFAVGDPPGAGSIKQRLDAGPRVPYEGELLPLVENVQIPAEVRVQIRDFHEKMVVEAAAHQGTISETRMETVRAFLDRYR